MRQQPRSSSGVTRVVVTSAGLAALALVALPLVNAQSFSDWSAPMNLGPAINTNYADSCVSVSKNGRSLYLASGRLGGLGQWDLWVAQRTSTEDDWGIPQWLGYNINSASNESCPALSLDEHRLYFVSGRPGGCGGSDLYVSRRHDRRDDFDWEPAENLGCMPDGVNSPQADYTPAFFEDHAGREVMYFGSTRTGGLGVDDIYASVMEDDLFGPAEMVSELSSTSSESGATIRRDGLEVIFSSNRPGGLGGLDLWMATRTSTRKPWSNLANLSALNSPLVDGGRMSLSFDGLTLFHTSDRAGSLGSRDLYMATRTKVR